MFKSVSVGDYVCLVLVMILTTPDTAPEPYRRASAFLEISICLISSILINEYPISYNGRTYEQGKKIKAIIWKKENQQNKILQTIKNRQK